MAKQKFLSLEQATAYVNSLPIAAIIDGYAKLLFESDQVEPVKITREQLEKLFKIVGETRTGELERRGRPRKEF